MKIYQINIVCGNGSTGKIAVDIAKKIDISGGQCRIAYGRGESSKDVDAICICKKEEVYWHVLMTRLTDKHGLYSRRATGRLIEDIKKSNPDIIHLHNIHGYYLNYERLFAFLREYKKPVVWTLHDCWAFTGHCAHFIAKKCMKWQVECKMCIAKKTYPSAVLFGNCNGNFLRKKETFTNIDNLTIVTVSDWLKQMTEKSFLNCHAIERIYNGVDIENMKPTENSLRQEYHLENKKIVLGVANVWSEGKGLDVFYRLAEMVDSSYVFVVIGLDKKQIRRLPRNIVGISRTQNQKELAQWYTVADVYVNASIEETFGLTTVEALACGTPAIVMNTTANPELVTGDCGAVVEPGDMEQLRCVIAKIGKTESVSEKCIARAKGFSKQLQGERYMQLYEKILDKHELGCKEE